MSEETVPPLKREALDQIPAVQQELVEFWAMLQQITATMLQKLAGFDPDRLPALELAEWVEGHLVIAHHLVNAVIDLHKRLWPLQEHTPDPEFLEMVIHDLEDDAAPTD